MNVILVCVRDALSGFSAPQQEINGLVAVRHFRDAVAQTDNIMGRHADEFSLWKVGDFDLETGEIRPCMEKLCEAAEVPSDA